MAEPDYKLLYEAQFEHALALAKDVTKARKERDDIINVLRRIFNGKTIYWDSNGWADVTMHEDEVEMIQEAIRVY